MNSNKENPLLGQLLQSPDPDPDPDPAETLLTELKRAVQTRHPEEVAKSKQLCEEEWSRFPPQRRVRLIHGYRKRLF